MRVPNSVGQNVPRDVVLGGTEAAGHQHGVGAGARKAEHLRDAAGVVAHRPGGSSTSTPISASRSPIHFALVLAI